MPPKRRSESGPDENRPNNREEGQNPSDILEEIDEIIEEYNGWVDDGLLHGHLAFGVAELPRGLLEEGTSTERVSATLTTFKKYCIAVKARVEWGNLDLRFHISHLDRPLEVLQRQLLMCVCANLDTLVKLAKELEDTLSTKPSPSEYAISSVWKDCQARPNPILCLRPSDNMGLPLTLLHQIFAKFQTLRLRPLPNSTLGAHSPFVALRLCRCTGDGYEDKDARGDAFDIAVGSFLPKCGGQSKLIWTRRWWQSGPCLPSDGTCAVFREDKEEMGGQGMHILRLHVHTIWHVRIWKE